MKIRRIFLVLAALLCAGILAVSCSDDSGGGGENNNNNTVGGGGATSVTGVSLNTPSLVLLANDTAPLTATVSGTNLSDADKAVTWSAANSAIATVSNGTVTALKAGSTTITAASKKDPSKKATCIVEVIDNTPQAKVLYNFDYSKLGSYSSGTTSSYHTSAEFYDRAVYLYYNASSGTALRIRSDGSTNTAINYNGENTTVATGAVGDAISGGSQYCGIDLSKLSISSPDEVTVSFKVKAVKSDNAKSDTGIVYLVDVSTGKAVAVETSLKLKSGSDERTLTAKVAKNADIRVYFSRNGSEAGGLDITEIKVVDESATETITLPSSITLNKTTAALEINEENLAPTVTLSETLAPSNVTTGYNTVTWSTSDASVATVANGVVTAKKAGTATITATTKNGKTATCTVTVTSTLAVNYIRASDSPIGFASVGAASPFGGQGGTVVTVSNKADFKTYAESSSKYVIYVEGMIDLSEGMLPTTAGGSTTALDNFVKNATGLERGPYSSYNDFKTKYAGACTASTDDKSSTSPKSTYGKDLWKLNKAYSSTVTINVKSDKTIIGVGENSGFKGGRINISTVNNVAIRNLTIQDAYDPFPHHEKNDGFNAELDCIVVQGSSENIWIDHCTLRDTLYASDVSISGGTEKWQTFDGLCDIKNSTKNVTVSNCYFYDHDKTMLIGSSDTDGSNATRTVSLIGNYFHNCGQRLPMVRNTRLHAYNNYYYASNPHYSQQYAIGVRSAALIFAENNYFEGISYAYKDGKHSDSNNGNGSVYHTGDGGTANESFSGYANKVTSAPFTVPYSYTPMSAAEAKAYAKANAGAGKWVVKK